MGLRRLTTHPTSSLKFQPNSIKEIHLANHCCDDVNLNNENYRLPQADTIKRSKGKHLA